MWFLFTLLCTAAWGVADLFYKKGNTPDEKLSHLKTSVFVGAVMGAHALFLLVRSGFDYDFRNILVYLPVSSMYILSMTLGYFGLRYLELSVSSPVQNTSGAIVCILCLVFLGETLDLISGIAVVLICAGVFLLGLFEYLESAKDSLPGDEKYRRSFKAFLFPILYCVFDALGTFFDAWYLDDPASTPLIGVTEENLENAAEISYELTFFICAVFLYIFIRCVKKEKLIAFRGTSLSRLAAALFETAGQFFYVYAMSGNGAVAAPVVASYCMVSVILSRILLREKLTWRKYAAIALAFAGILMLGIAEGLAE